MKTKSFTGLVGLAAAVLTVSAAAGNGYSQTVSANGPTAFNARDGYVRGNVGVPYPLVNGQQASTPQRAQFEYQIMANAQFTPLNTQFTFAPNGYNASSPDNQYGFWDNGGNDAGIWLRPVTRDYRFRIGLNGSWVEYQLTGDPGVPRPDPDIPGNTIALGTPDDPAIAGWDLVWQDEFNGGSLNAANWNTDIGVGDGGWGNQERQYYTNSPANLYVEDGMLHIRAVAENRVTGGYQSRFTSAKVTTAGKFSVRYGRIDFRVSLPLGQGFWPALWMMPQNSPYGSWPAGGEIDIMEAKGRIPGASSAAIHYGGIPCCDNHRYVHGDYTFPQGGSINNFNVYTLIWEADRFDFYVNGNRFFSPASGTWWTAQNGVTNANPLAPFDQSFYLIMNLAVGGHFDGYLEPAASDLPGIMRVDYARVYKPGDSTATAARRGAPEDINAAGSITRNAPVFAGISNGQINLLLTAGNYTAELYCLRGRLAGKANIRAANGVNASGLRADKLPGGVFILSVREVGGGAPVLKQKIVLPTSMSKDFF